MVNERPSTNKRLISALGLALLVSFALSAVAAGPASASTQHWYSCKYVGETGGSYLDNGCSIFSKLHHGSYDWTKLTEPTEAYLEGTTDFTLKWMYEGKIETSIICSSTRTYGKQNKIANPVGGGAGTFGGNVKLSNCEIHYAGGKPRFEGCQLIDESGAVDLVNLGWVSGEGSEFEGAPALNMRPGGGVFYFKLVNCSYTPEFNGWYWLNGSITGVVNQAESLLAFSEASSDLHFNGEGEFSFYEPVIEGTARMELLSNHEVWKLAP